MIITKFLEVIQAENLADQRQVIVNCSAESDDRAGDVIVQRGIDFGPFMKIGGTVLWQHDPDQPIAKAIEMDVTAGRLRSRVQFPAAGVSPKADEIYGLVRAGVVNGVSIGFVPLDFELLDPRDPSGPRKYNRVELMEFSFVSVPCNRESVVVARSAGATVRLPLRVAQRGTVMKIPDDDEIRETIDNALAELDQTLARWHALKQQHSGSRKTKEPARQRAAEQPVDPTGRPYYWDPYKTGAVNSFELRKWLMRGGRMPA